MDDIPPDLEASIGGPPTNQITGASDITVNESSVALDPPVRTVGVLQVIQDVDSFPQAGEGNFTTSSKFLFLAELAWKEMIRNLNHKQIFNGGRVAAEGFYTGAVALP